MLVFSRDGSIIEWGWTDWDKMRHCSIMSKFSFCIINFKRLCCRGVIKRLYDGNVCAHGIKRKLPSYSNHCILRFRRDNIMHAQAEEDFVFACLQGAYIPFLRQQEEGSCRKGMPECISREEREEGGWEGQDPCGCANGYRKTESSNWATTQHFSLESSSPKMSTPSRTTWGCLQSSSTRSWKE